MDEPSTPEPGRPGDQRIAALRDVHAAEQAVLDDTIAVTSAERTVSSARIQQLAAGTGHRDRQQPAPGFPLTAARLIPDAGRAVPRGQPRCAVPGALAPTRRGPCRTGDSRPARRLRRRRTALCDDAATEPAVTTIPRP